MDEVPKTLLLLRGSVNKSPICGMRPSPLGENIISVSVNPVMCVWEVVTVIDLMNLEEQVDLDFTLARRRARLRRLKELVLRRRGTRSTLLSPEETRRGVPASGSMYRGRRTVEVFRIVGSVGKHEHFDPNFMPLSKASPEKWKRIDRAFRLGVELPAVSLLQLGGDYFVIDGNHRVSVARFHGVEWIDAEVTEVKTLGTRAA